MYDSDEANAAVKAAEIEAGAVDRQTNMAFLVTDFSKAFDVYIRAHAERSEATRMFVLILTGPFVLLSLFGIATNINITPSSSLIDVASQFPSFVFLAFTLFGLTGIVPYHRFISAHANAYKMIRYLNCYRLFFYQNIQDEIDVAKWRSAIEKDPMHPIPRIFRNHWTSYFGFAMCAANTLYIGLGVWLLENQASPIGAVICGVGSLILHFILANQELRAEDVSRLTSQGVPVPELLRRIESDVSSIN